MQFYSFQPDSKTNFLIFALMLQLLYLMDVVQNGIRQPNLRLTFPLALYIARVAQQMLKPGIAEQTL